MFELRRQEPGQLLLQYPHGFQIRVSRTPRDHDGQSASAEAREQREHGGLGRSSGSVHRRVAQDYDPLVFAQEYETAFVDWSGVAFFGREKLLVDNQPIPLPERCDCVFTVIDTASKTGTDNDGTAVTFFAYTPHTPVRLHILDRALAQIEGGVLEQWLPGVFQILEELSRSCGARRGAGPLLSLATSQIVAREVATLSGDVD